MGTSAEGIYTTPNAEYACRYASSALDEPGAVVMCRACVPSVYCVTVADYDGSNATGHSNLYGQALKSEEAHFALVSEFTNYEACDLERAQYCELCVSQVAALCPIAVLCVEEADKGQPTVPPTVFVAQSQLSQSFDDPAISIVTVPRSTALLRHTAASHRLHLREGEIGMLPPSPALGQ